MVPVPDDNDIARYVSPSNIDGDELDGDAFLPGKKDGYLSVFRLNMIEGDDISSRIEYLKKDIPLNTSPNGKLGVINVGTMRELVESEENRKPAVTREPIDCKDERLKCDYHCGVRGMKYDDEIIAELIALCVTERHSTLKKSKLDRISTAIPPESAGCSAPT